MVTQVDDCSEQLLAMGRDSPATRPRDLGQQTTDVHSLQQSRDRIRLSLPFWSMFELSPACFANFGVSEASQQMFAGQYRLEQTNVVTTRRFETRSASASHANRPRPRIETPFPLLRELMCF